MTMTIEKLVDLGIINDTTEIYIRDMSFGLITKGSWFQDNVLEHIKDEIDSYTWQDDNRIYVDLK